MIDRQANVTNLVMLLKMILIHWRGSEHTTRFCGSWDMASPRAWLRDQAAVCFCRLLLWRSIMQSYVADQHRLNQVIIVKVRMVKPSNCCQGTFGKNSNALQSSVTCFSVLWLTEEAVSLFQQQMVIIPFLQLPILL